MYEREFGFICNSLPFLEIAISTFLGFSSTLLVEAIVAFIRGWKTKARLLSDLIAELKVVESVNQEMIDTIVYIQPYSIPVWQGACASGTILCLDKEKYYPKLLEVFSSISEANLVEMKCFEIVMAKEQQPLIINTLRENRANLRTQISELLKMLEGDHH